MLNTSINSTLLGILVLIVFGCSKDVIDHEDEGGFDYAIAQINDWERAKEVLDVINNHRIAINRNPLAEGALEATVLAIEHDQYMIKNKVVNHDYFFSRSNTLKEMIGAKKVSEVIAYNYATATSVLNAWLRSDSHKTIIEGDFDHVGLGIIQSPKDNRLYYTLILYTL